MKKIILTAAAVFAFSFANAQDVKYGAKAGLNLSNFGGDTDALEMGDLSMKVGFQVGGFAEIKVSDKFAVQPELLYSTQGTKLDGGKINTSYLNIPVIAKYFVAEGFSLEAGPQIGFLMSAKAKDDDGDSVDIKDVFNSTDFGINLGAGYDVAENINLGLRYTLGLSNILKDSGDVKVNNSNIAFAVAYKF